MADAFRPEKPIWRVGAKVGRTIYRDNVLVGVMDTPGLAGEIVNAIQQEQASALIGRLDHYRIWTSAKAKGEYCVAICLDIERFQGLVWASECRPTFEQAAIAVLAKAAEAEAR